MQTSPMLLPKPVGDVFARLPAYPGSLLFVTALNLALAKQLGEDVGDMLKAGGYVETSPSGTGVHAYALGALPPGPRRAATGDFSRSARWSGA